MNRFATVAILALVAGCTTTADPLATSTAAPAAESGPRVSASQAGRNFDTVIRRVAPVARQICQEKAPRANCNYQIYVDERPNQPVNAFQTEDESGRPVIVFTRPLIEDARNADELAFILGHEAAHHIEGHLAATRVNSQLGAVLLGSLAQAYGLSGSGVDTAATVGAEIGSRTFSKGYETEADSLGAEIAWRAGYDPVRGVAFFSRTPDPGDQFLGTHPPNASRQANVRKIASQFQQAQGV
ncbi:M48 family metalloprotease [Tropicimonas sp.]|uniref:M48 family metalloprotease n=1 Tax=Tropicimonas sp. TaxID=2067044 RepID=UPI003A898509